MLMVNFQCLEEEESFLMIQTTETRVLSALEYLCWLFSYYKVFALCWFCLCLYYNILVEVKPSLVTLAGQQTPLSMYSDDLSSPTALQLSLSKSLSFN